jgi:hypothetical protein
MKQNQLEKRRDETYNQYVHQRARVLDMRRELQEQELLEAQWRAQVALLNALIQEEKDAGRGTVDAGAAQE